MTTKTPDWTEMRVLVESARARQRQIAAVHGPGYVARRDQADASTQTWAARIGVDLSDPAIVHALAAGICLVGVIAAKRAVVCMDVLEVLSATWGQIEHLAPGGHDEVRAD